MKTTTYALLAASTVSAQVLPTLDTFPAMVGSAPRNTEALMIATSSCFECIRGGYIWCSAKWNYQMTTIKTKAADSSDGTNKYYTDSEDQAIEKGKCCFAKIADKGDNTKANVTRCPARFSNASGSTVVELAYSSWWCSNDIPT